MASEEPENPFPNTAETDEEATAFLKKRSRRVSFADREITAVHIFNRDEDYETPPNSSSEPKPTSSGNNENVVVEDEVLGFFKDLANSNESKDELCFSPVEDDGFEDDGQPFLKLADSPSSGCSYLASASSNEADEFFGPVSAQFIRPGRLSDSVVSDENHHDVTMDSTAFSMHFRSLARSESGDLKTPTELHPATEEIIPSQATTPSGSGSMMILTEARRLFVNSPLSVVNVSGGGDSTDMSLVGETLFKYDYGRISPTLKAILADGIQNVDGETEMDSLGTHDTSADRLPMVKSISGGENGSLVATQAKQIMHVPQLCVNSSPNINPPVDPKVQTPKSFSKVQENTEFGRVGNGVSISNSEFPAVLATPQDTNCKAVQDISMLRESGSQHLPGDQLNINTSIDKKQHFSINKILDQQSKPPLVASISSLSDKRRLISFDAANSYGPLSYATPSPKQPRFHLSQESIKRTEHMSSIKKSNSLLASSPCSALLDRIEKTKVVLSKQLPFQPSSSRFDTVEIGKSSKHITLGTLDDQPLSAGLKEIQHESAINRSSKVVDAAGFVKGDESPNGMGKPICITAEVPSSREQLEGNYAVAENLTEGIEVIYGTNSKSVDVAYDHRVTSSTTTLLSSPKTKLDEKLLESTDGGDLEQQAPLNGINNSSTTQLENPIELVSTGNYTMMTDVSDSLSVERGVQSDPPLIKINNSKETQDEILNCGECQLPELQNLSGRITSFVSPLNEKDATKFQMGSPGEDRQTTPLNTRSDEELTAEVIDKSQGMSSPMVHSSKNDHSFLQSQSKGEFTQSPLLKNLTQSLSLKKLAKSPRLEVLHTAQQDGSRKLFVGKDILSPNSSINIYSNDKGNQEINILGSQISEQELEGSSRQKRKGKEIFLSDTDHLDNTSSLQKSPKIPKVSMLDPELNVEHSDGSNNKIKKTGGATTSMQWTDISQKLLAETSQMLSTSFGTLNIRLIREQEDVLDHMKKAHLCEIIRSEIQSQKGRDLSSSIRNKRLAESSALLCNLAFEKGKLQLIHIKREKLLKSIQLLNSEIQETKKSRSNLAQHLSVPGNQDAQDDDNLQSSCIGNPEQRDEVSAELATKMEENEALDCKIKRLTKSLHNYCKIEGEPSCAETIVLANEHIRKKMHFRVIRQHIQSWDVADVDTGNDQCSIVIKYRGFISQRLTMKSGPVSNLLISNKLSDTFIMKNFPNMDAWTAFSSVFVSESSEKYIGSRSFAHEIQKTNYLLHNLLEVVLEVQGAWVEIRNLMHANFKSTSDDQLHLRLSFIESKTGRKVIMTFNMACLIRGIYPAQILPCKLQAAPRGEDTSLPQSLSDEIKTAIGSLDVGYHRIARLCRRVSEVLHS